MSLTLYKRGKTWHYRGTLDSQRLRGSTGTQDKAVAQRLVSELEAQFWQERLDGRSATLTFAEAAMYYRAARKETRFLRKIEAHWGNTLVKNITAGAIIQSALDLYPNVGPATRNRQVIVPTQAVINHVASLDLCPPIRVKRFPVVKRERPYVDWPWIEAFMKHAGTPHLAALAGFMYLTGARISDALRLRWEDVDLGKQTALIRSNKNKVERSAHLPPLLVAALANIEGERKGPVFRFRNRSNARTQWAGTIRRAGIKPRSYHACRHGFATGMLRKGIDVVTVAKRGGWKSPAQVFETYGHASDDPTLVECLIDTPATQSVEKIRKSGR